MPCLQEQKFKPKARLEPLHTWDGGNTSFVIPGGTERLLCPPGGTFSLFGSDLAEEVQYLRVLKFRAKTRTVWNKWKSMVEVKVGRFTSWK